jgi:hypothetical protein
MLRLVDPSHKAERVDLEPEAEEAQRAMHANLWKGHTPTIVRGGAGELARHPAARRLLLARRSVDDSLIGGLLSQRAAWALHEILAGPHDDEAVAALERAAGDPRLSRIERHRLREELRLERPNEKKRD